MQASSANLEELCVAQLLTSVGSSGTTTGDHKTSTMQTNPSILNSVNTTFRHTIQTQLEKERKIEDIWKRHM